MIWAVLALTLAVNTRRPIEPEPSTGDVDTSPRALAEIRNSP
jgi:hypothetical protein